MGFIVLPRLTLSGYIFSVENTRASLRPPFLTFLTYYYFLHARLINPPPRFYENVVINTPRMPVCFSLCQILPPSRLALREMPALNHFTLLSIRWGGKKKEETSVHSHARQKEKRRGKRNERKKREKRQRTGAGGACANVHCRVFSHGVAPRRQASSVARRAPSYSHVILYRAARAHAVRVAARSRLDSSPDLSFFPFFFRQTLRTHLRNCIEKKKKNRDPSPNRNVKTSDFSIAK